MTREEAIKILRGEAWICCAEKWNEALDMAIKALEQESILDKIRAEIEHHRRKTQYIDPHDLIGDCLDIIDKCIESEKEVCKSCYYNDGEVHAECVICNKTNKEEK